MTRKLFVTGTDTGVGKTAVSVALLRAFQASGTTAAGMKPVASGCISTAQGWRNDDALALQAASDGRPDYASVNPYALPDATAPQIAARHAGVTVALPAIVAACQQLAALADVLVIEGVGGWLAPLADGLDQGDLAQALGVGDVVLVVGMRLGCINHARLTERAILGDGFVLAGWVANADSNMLDFPEEYFEALQAAMSTRCLGRLPFAPDANATERASALSLP